MLVTSSIIIRSRRVTFWPKIRSFFRLIGSVIFVLVGFSNFTHAQNSDETQLRIMQLQHPLAPANTNSPQETLATFLENITKGYQFYQLARSNYEKESGFFTSEEVKKQSEFAQQKTLIAVRTLDLSQIPPAALKSVRLESVLLLKEVLDRIEIPPLDSIPNSDLVRAEGIETWTIPNTEIKISKVKDGNRAGEFLFDASTIERIREFYERVKDLPYRTKGTEGMYTSYTSSAGRLLAPKWLSWIDRLPPWMKQTYKGQTIWQWVALVHAFLIAVLVPLIIHLLFKPLFRRLRSPWLDWMRLVVPITLLLSLTLANFLIFSQFNISGQALVFSTNLLKGIGTLVVVWIIFLFARAISATIVASPRVDPRGLRASVIRVSANVFGGLLGLAFFVWGAERLGIPLVPLLGGLGLGGLAVALAIGPTLENLIGGLTLYFDQSVRVGDFCRYGDKSGTVEKIGLRSTRVRAFNRTVTSIPNSEFSNMQITNVSYRDKRLIREVIGLRYETSPEQLRYVMTKIREMLIAHPLTEEKPLPTRVRLIGFGASSFDIEIFAYVTTKKLNEFFALREDVFLRVIDIVEESGTGFAFPSMTTYLARDVGLDSEKTEAAERHVSEWREQGQLPFPHFAATQIESLNNTIEFPPKGSSIDENKKS